MSISRFEEILGLRKNSDEIFWASPGETRSFKELETDSRATFSRSAPEALMLPVTNDYASVVEVIRAIRSGLVPHPSHPLLFADPAYRASCSAQANKFPFGELSVPRSSYFIVRSSGSSGKGFKFILHNLDGFIDKFLALGPRFSKCVFFSPLESIAGIELLLEAIVHGKSLVAPNVNTDPYQVIKAGSENDVDYFSTTPSFLHLMLLTREFNRASWPALKIISYGSEPSQEPRLREVCAHFPGTELVHTYGMSELGILKTFTPPERPFLFRLDPARNPGRINDGLLEVYSPTRMIGYLTEPLVLNHDGWFHTGDCVEEVAGALKVTGRIDDVINVAGNKFMPVHLEEKFNALDIVQDTTIVTSPHPLIGTTLIARIELRAGQDTATARNLLKSFCETRLPRWMIPNRIEFVDGARPGLRMKKMRRL